MAAINGKEIISESVQKKLNDFQKELDALIAKTNNLNKASQDLNKTLSKGGVEEKNKAVKESVKATSDLNKETETLNNTAKRQETLLKASIGSQKAVNDGIKALTVSSKEYREQIKKLEKENALITKSALAYGKVTGANKKQINANNKAISSLSLKLQENGEDLKDLNSIRKRNISLLKSESGSITEAVAKNKILRKERDSLNLSTKEGVKRLRDLNKAINKNSEFIKKNNDAATQQKTNIGNYGSALNELPGPLGRAGQAVKGLGKAFKALLANPVVLVIAAITAAIATFVSSLKRSEKGQDALNKALAVGEAILDIVLDLFTGLSETIIDAFDDPKQAVIDLWDTIKNNLVTRVIAVPKLFQGAFKLIKDAITGNDIKEGLNELKDAAIELSTGVDAKKVVKALDDIGKKAADNVAKAAKAADIQASLDKLERVSLVRKAKLEKEVAETRLEIDKKNEKNALQRLVLSNKAALKEKEILKLDQEIAEERLRIKVLQNSISKTNKTDLKEEAELRAELFRVQTSRLTKLKAIEEERQTALKENLKEIDEIWGAIDDEFYADLQAQTDEIVSSTDEVVEKTLEGIEKIAKANDEAARKRRINSEEEDKIEVEKKTQRLAAIQEIQSALDAGTNFAIALQERELVALQNKFNKGLISEEEFAKKSAAIRTKQANFEKASAIAQSIINTAVAVTSLLATPPLAILAGITGALQTAAIIAQPIPAYKDGTPKGGHKGGDAIVGDGGRHELGILPDGTLFKTPNTPTRMSLPDKTIIKPDFDKGLKELSTKQNNQPIRVKGPDKLDVAITWDGGVISRHEARKRRFRGV